MEDLEGYKIHCLSDTHTKHKQFALPGGDLLIHAGDMSFRGEYANEVMPFLKWYAKQPYTHKVLIPGNHDWCFEHNPEGMKQECDDLGIVLLNDSGVELDGIKIWGSPVTPWFHDWAFNRQRGSEIKMHWDLIPNDTEILITHGPAYQLLDYVPRGENVGCADLLDKILESQVKMHVSGHIHEGRGHAKFKGKLFVNASSLDGRYQPVKGVPIRVVKDLTGEYIVDNPPETIEE